MKKKNSLMLVIAGIISLVLITVGVTYAFFNYVKEGTTDNTITTSTITFLYTEIDKVGAGISIKDAYPISDSQGKMLSGTNEVFDFKITSTTPNTSSIPYEITARKNSDSTLDESAVKLYLTKVVGTSEEEVLLSKYSDLGQTSKVSKDKYTEKTIYTGKVPADSKNYDQAFKLRMWVSSDTDFSPDENDNYPYNNKEFSITVNVYANAKVVTEEEVLDASKAEISSLSVNGEELTPVTDQDYHYEISLPEGTTSTTLDIETEGEYATVKVERIDSLAYSSNIRRLSTKKAVDLNPGDNYFKVTVTSENGKVEKEYKIKITVENVTVGESILEILKETDLEDGYHIFRVNNVDYSVHLYNYNGNQLFVGNNSFGDENDVATANSYAKNMVIVKVDGDLTIDKDAKVEPHYDLNYGGPKGFMLYVTGTLTNNGTIDNSHGAKAEGQNVYLWKNEDGTYEYVPSTGANGGDSITSSNTSKGSNYPGKSGTGRQTGGGGSGAGLAYAAMKGTGTAGSAGTSYSGGTGGGAGLALSGGISDNNGGAGGSGITHITTLTAGGGAGNPAGKGSQSSSNGTNGTGGLLIIYAYNYINNNIISANGSAGGTGHVGGGGSGAGSINVFYNDFLKQGTVQKNGGSVSGKSPGGTGGNGTVTYTQINLN